MTLLRSFAVYFSTLFWALAYWSLMPLPLLAMAVLPKEKRRHLGRVVLLWFGRLTVRVAWRPFFKVRYRDLSGGARTPGIVIANHRAATDAFLVSLPGFSAAQTVNGWPMRLPVIGWMAAFSGYLDITGWDYDMLLERVGRTIGCGDMVISYPEGTRSEGTRMNPFHSGIFRVAKDLEVPVYMLCIAGNQYMPDRKFRFREFHDLEVRLLAPIPVEEVRSCATGYALKKRVFCRMEEELAAMDDELEHERTI